MAQSTKSSSTRARSRSSNGAQARKGASSSAAQTRRRASSSSNGAQTRKRASSGATRAKSSGTRATSSGTRAKASASRAKSSASRAKSSGESAVSKAGSKVGEFASKAKTPLLAGGAALAGIAGGVAMKNRSNSRSAFKKLSGPSMSMPKSLKKIDLGKIDFETITSAAQRAGKIGQQVGDVAEAAEKARKKSK